MSSVTKFFPRKRKNRVREKERDKFSKFMDFIQLLQFTCCDFCRGSRIWRSIPIYPFPLAPEPLRQGRGGGTVCRYLLFWAETDSVVQSWTRSYACLIPLFYISSDQKTTFKSNIFMVSSAKNRRKLICLHPLQDFNASACARAHTHTHIRGKGVTWVQMTVLIKDDWLDDKRQGCTEKDGGAGGGLKVLVPAMSEDTECINPPSLHNPHQLVPTSFPNTILTPNHIWQQVLIRRTGRINACWWGSKIQGREWRRVRDFRHTEPEPGSISSLSIQSGWDWTIGLTCCTFK